MLLELVAFTKAESCPSRNIVRAQGTTWPAPWTLWTAEHTSACGSSVWEVVLFTRRQCTQLCRSVESARCPTQTVTFSGQTGKQEEQRELRRREVPLGSRLRPLAGPLHRDAFQALMSCLPPSVSAHPHCSPPRGRRFFGKHWITTPGGLDDTGTSRGDSYCPERCSW